VAAGVLARRAEAVVRARVSTTSNDDGYDYGTDHDHETDHDQVGRSGA
jgi:hypothetical protein